LRHVSGMDPSRRLGHVRLGSGFVTIPDIFADDCRTNLSVLK
jgi:hypothetical protein